MYDFSYYTPTVSSGFSGSMVWTIISFILAIIGGILVYILFLNKNEKINNKWIGEKENGKIRIWWWIIRINRS